MIRVNLPHRLGKLGLEGWKSGKISHRSTLTVIPSEQKNKTIGFYGHRDSICCNGYGETNNYLYTAAGLDS